MGFYLKEVHFLRHFRSPYWLSVVLDLEKFRYEKKLREILHRFFLNNVFEAE